MLTGDGIISTHGSRSTAPWVRWGGGCGGRTYGSASTGCLPQFGPRSGVIATIHASAHGLGGL